MYIVKCKQLVPDSALSDPEDREDMALGQDGVYEYESYTDTVSSALDLFHDNVAIGCLDDYEIWVEDEKGNRVEEKEAVFVFELKVHDDGDIEVRRIPDGFVTDNMTFGDTTGLADEIRSYGSRDSQAIGAMVTELHRADDFEWVTV